MRKRIKKRLRNRRGESITEVLVALLISALALTLLAMMINTTARMVTRGKELTKTYVAGGNVLAEKSGGTAKSGTASLWIVDQTGNSVSIKLRDTEAEGTELPVKFYTNTSIGGDPVIAYTKDSP